jgi:hypothetical protein
VAPSCRANTFGSYSGSYALQADVVERVPFLLMGLELGNKNPKPEP